MSSPAVSVRHARPFEGEQKAMAQGSGAPADLAALSFAEIVQRVEKEAESNSSLLKKDLSKSSSPLHRRLTELFNAAYGLLNPGRAGGGSVTLESALWLHSSATRRDEDDKTPLMLAAQAGKVDDVRAYIVLMVDVNAIRGNGSTALMYAARYDRRVVADVLTTAGAKVNTANLYSWTALMFAVAHEHRILAKQLIAAGADKDKDWATAKEKGRQALCDQFSVLYR